MKRPAKWKVVTITLVLGGLNLLGIAYMMLKPHLAGGTVMSISVNAAAGLGAAPATTLRNCDGAGGGGATSPQTRVSFRIRMSPDRRTGGCTGFAGGSSITSTAMVADPPPWPPRIR